MPRSVVRKLVLVSIALSLAAPSFVDRTDPVSPLESSGGSREGRQLPPRVVAAGLRADGRVVRRSGAATVERIAMPREVRAEHAEARGPLWRVTVRGSFPPRALRYEVLAGEQLVAFGIPTASGRAVRGITAKPSVLGAPISVRYGDDARAARGGAATAGPARTPRASSIPNPAARGPYEVTREVYDFGDEVFQPSEVGGRVEITADVHYPFKLSDGPYPLVLFMHGNHVTCFREGRVAYRWPCGAGWEPLPNYAGYDYIARRLASHGYVVVSVSANGVNVLGNRVDDTGMRQRGELLDRHLELWERWATTGGEPFGTRFVGKVDLSRIGTMGHSRGGEGVVWHRIVDEERPDPFGVDAVLALAPVDFTRARINRATFAVVLPECDGDVSDLQGVHLFDDSRYAVPGDPTSKHTVMSFAANHNFFNTVWTPGGGYPGGSDDGRWTRCGDRLTAPQQRRVGMAYVAGFFRRYLGDELALDPMWTGATSPRFIEPARTLVSYLAPDRPEHRMDLARFTDARDLSAGQTAELIPSALSLYGWCADTFATPCFPGRSFWSDIHLPGLGQGQVGWSDQSGVLRFAPSRTDLSGYDALQLRAALNNAYPANGGVRYQDFTVVLIDGGGDQAALHASEVGNEALVNPARTQGRHTMLNQIRFPLARFVGVDLDDIRSVELRFDRMRDGAINIADVAFSAGGAAA